MGRHATESLALRQSRGNPWEVLYTTTPVSVIAPPLTVLYNEVVDLGQWGLVYDQYLCNPDVVVTKLDNGVRRGTYPAHDDRYEPRPVGAPPADAPLVGVMVMCMPLMNAEGTQAARGDWNSGPQTATGSVQEFEPSSGWWNPVTVEVVPISWPAGAAFQPVVAVVPAVLWGARAKIQVTLATDIVYEIRVFGWTVAT